MTSLSHSHAYQGAPGRAGADESYGRDPGLALLQSIRKDAHNEMFRSHSDTGWPTKTGGRARGEPRTPDRWSRRLLSPPRDAVLRRFVAAGAAGLRPGGRREVAIRSRMQLPLSPNSGRAWCDRP